MAQIITLGETVCDIIFKQEQPVAAKAGGSMLNATVSLGRVKLPVYYCSEYGLDDLGKNIDVFLHENNVDTQYAYKHPDGKTSIAIAMLDEKSNASYSFYKELPIKPLNVNLPHFTNDDFLIFGSFFSISKRVREKVETILKQASQGGALILYDPNFRKAHLHELDEMLPMIIENMKYASIVRGSDEDFELIFGAKTVDEAYSNVSAYCPVLVYTKSSECVFVRTPAIKAEFPVQTLKPVSTIGAGDNFNAGLIASLFSNVVTKEQLQTQTENQWKPHIEMAVAFASNVCMSFDNYISIEFAKELRLLV